MRGYNVNCSILLSDLPLLHRPSAARAAGFSAVEFWWPFDVAVPADRDVDAFVAAIRDAGVSLVGLNFYAGDMAAGDRGLMSQHARRSEFRDSVDVALDIGRRLGCTLFNALYGNRIADSSTALQDDTALENLKFAAQSAAADGATVLIEAISGAPAYPLRTPQDVAKVVAAAEESNVAMLADLYHFAVNGVDVGWAIGAYRSLIGHVQIADAPGRGAPGSGSLNVDGYLKQLADGGYRGWIGLEYQARSDDPFAWLPRPSRAADHADESAARRGSTDGS
ncbi:hydroxypyruvate isomerase family protein [Mycobacterium simiae]|uniref:hydroxypyruvate isomerase family protein n=1 Tax=Mycobacterium simiae TaxID=1784 RepID=UPI00261A107F|nr:TIM barrel protein [Mycobacterium simiae]